jgi:hypothetical protein
MKDKCCCGNSATYSEDRCRNCYEKEAVRKMRFNFDDRFKQVESSEGGFSRKRG